MRGKRAGLGDLMQAQRAHDKWKPTVVLVAVAGSAITRYQLLTRLSLPGHELLLSWHCSCPQGRQADHARQVGERGEGNAAAAAAVAAVAGMGGLCTDEARELVVQSRCAAEVLAY